MIYRTSKQEVEEYREKDALNQSRLKLLSISPQAFNDVKEPEMFFEEKEHFLVGSAVDDFITMGEEYFYDNYHLSQLQSKPSNVIMSIIQEAWSNKNSSTIVTHKKEILEAVNNHEWQPRYKDDTKINKVIEQGRTYWNELRDSDGKTILDSEQYTKIMSIVNRFQSSKVVSTFLKDSDNIDLYFQLPIYWEMFELPCKALLDLVIVDHSNKTIRPVDIKTVGDYIKNFPYQCLRRRYDIQASWYETGLKFLMGTGFFGDYTLLPFTFLVCSTTTEESPVVFYTDQEFLDNGKIGFYKSSLFGIDTKVSSLSKNHYKGWSDFIDDYNWYEKFGWNEDKELVESNYQFKLNGVFNKY